MSQPTLFELIYAPENEKLDLKQQAWDLDTREGKAEFIKDVSAIANSPGFQTGFILLGITDVDRSPIGVARDCLQEERLQQIVAEYVDPPFTLSYTARPLLDTYVGVIAIPASLHRPHLIAKDISRLHKSTCYTRRGSITALAKSSDLRTMIEAVLRDTPIEEEDVGSERAWRQADVARLDHLALTILQGFIQTGKTELSLAELKEHCHHELAGAVDPGKTLGGKLKIFYSRYDKDKLVSKNPQTGRWRFNENYRSCVEAVLHKRGFI